MSTRAIINRRHIPYDGRIRTDSTNVNYISGTMRAVADELAFDNTNKDRIELKQPFELNFGNNLWKHSNDFTNPVWNVSGDLVLTPNYDGEGTRVQHNGIVGFGKQVVQAINILSGEDYNTSLYVKANSMLANDFDVSVQSSFAGGNSNDIGNLLNANIGEYVRVDIGVTANTTGSVYSGILVNGAADLTIKQGQVSRGTLTPLPYVATTTEAARGKYIELSYNRATTGFDNVILINNDNRAPYGNSRIGVAGQTSLSGKAGSVTVSANVTTSTGVDTIIRLQMVGDYVEFIGVTQGTSDLVQFAGSGAPIFNNIGDDPLGILGGWTGTYYYIDFNGDKFEFNETGNNPFIKYE